MDTKTAKKQLVSLITEHLSDSIPVTRILTYKPSANGTVTGRFESSGRVYNFMFNGMDARYKPAMNADSALFSEYYLERFDTVVAPVKGARALPKCTSKSYSCKGSKGVGCVPLTKHCRMGTSAIGNERLGKIKAMSKFLAANGEDTEKIEATRAKIVEGRMALAVENRAKREPKKIKKAVVELAKTTKPKTKKIDIKSMTSNLEGLKDFKLPSAEKIKDFKEFKKVALDAYAEELYGSNRSKLLPISDLRKALGDKVTHEQFDGWMMDLKRDGSVNLLEMSDKELGKTPKSELQNLVYNKDLKQYFKTIESDEAIKEWSKKPRPLETTEKRKTKDGKQIMNAKDFEKVALKTYDNLTDKSGNKLAGIYEIRRAIGDRVTRAQFNDWMLEMNRNNSLRLHGGGSLQATDETARDSIYSELLKTYYFNAERFGESPKKKTK